VSFAQTLAEGRPVYDPETPFVAILDSTADIAIAFAKLSEYVILEPADLREEFGLRTSDERALFGAKLAVALLSFTAIIQEVSASLEDLFLTADDAAEPDDAEDDE
jgi:hypothetical protein